MTTLVAICGQPLVHALGWTLLHLCWQGAVVAVVLWCVLKVLDGRSSRARYAAACLALGLMVALPLATFAHLAAAEYRQRAALDDSAVVIDPGMVLRVEAGETSALLSERIAVALDHALPWVLLAWFAGVIFFAVRLNVGLLVARRMRLVATTAVPAELQQIFEAMRRRLGIARAVRLMHSALVQVPTVISWLRPVVLVPASCLTGLSTMQIEAILAHELAHIRRHDYLVSVVQSVIETVLFYHPAVWWVSKQVRRERECCCDELAVAVGGDRLGYARALSLLEERRSYNPEFVLGANGGVLTMRIKRLLGCREDSAVSQMAAFMVLALIVIAAGSYVVTMARAEVNALSHAAHAASPMDLEAVAPLNTVIVEPAMRQFRLTEPVLMAQAEAPAAGAAQGNGAIAGSIVDQTGAIVPGAKVSSVNTDNGTKVSSETDNSGKYSISSLQPGPYNVEVEANGFLRLLQENVRVDSGKTFSLNLKLTPNPLFRRPTTAVPDMSCTYWHDGIAHPGTCEEDKAAAGHYSCRSDDDTKLVQDQTGCEWKVKRLQELQRNNQESGASPILVAPPSPPPPSVILPLPQGPVRVYSGAVVAPGGPVRVSSGTLAGMTLTKVNPVYPEEAKAAHVQGAVILHAIISKQGTIEKLEIISGSGMLRQSSIDAVSKWTYKPYLLNGKPVEVETSITVNYTLGDSTTVVGPIPPADEASAGVKQVGGDVKGPMVIYEPEPSYTELAKQDKVEGIVLINMVVDEQGLPQHLHVSRGLGDGLDEKAVEAVKQYKFKPATENGKPVAVYLNVEVNFKIF